MHEREAGYQDSTIKYIEQEVRLMNERLTNSGSVIYAGIVSQDIRENLDLALKQSRFNIIYFQDIAAMVESIRLCMPVATIFEVGVSGRTSTSFADQLAADPPTADIPVILLYAQTTASAISVPADPNRKVAWIHSECRSPKVLSYYVYRCITSWLFPGDESRKMGSDRVGSEKTLDLRHNTNKIKEPSRSGVRYKRGSLVAVALWNRFECDACCAAVTLLGLMAIPCYSPSDLINAVSLYSIDVIVMDGRKNDYDAINIVRAASAISLLPNPTFLFTVSLRESSGFLERRELGRIVVNETEAGNPFLWARYSIPRALLSKEAVAHLRQEAKVLLLSDIHDTGGFLLLASALSYSGDFLAADDLYLFAIERDPTNYLTYLYRGRGLRSFKYSDDREVFALLEKAVDLCPSDPECHLELGIAYSSRGRPDDARREFLLAANDFGDVGDRARRELATTSKRLPLA